MTENDYSALSDERLLELFADGAKQLGFVTNRNERLRWLKGARETKPEVDDEARMPIIARTREIAEALRERKSIAAVKLLLERMTIPTSAPSPRSLSATSRPISVMRPCRRLTPDWLPAMSRICSGARARSRRSGRPWRN